MTIALELPAIKAFLEKQGLSPKDQKETQQLLVEMKFEEDNTVPLFLRILHQSVLQLVAYIPYQFEKNRLVEVARFLHQLNKDLDLPGFGMDETQRMAFFRVVIPLLDPKIEEALLMSYLTSVRLVCQSFIFAVAAVASGQTSPEEAMQKIQEKNTQERGS
jgi:hypothetical protein